MTIVIAEKTASGGKILASTTTSRPEPLLTSVNLSYSYYLSYFHFLTVLQVFKSFED